MKTIKKGILKRVDATQVSINKFIINDSLLPHSTLNDDSLRVRDRIKKTLARSLVK
jgi:hypothetical protein